MIDQPSAMHTNRLGRGRPARRGSRAGDQRPRSTQASQRPPTLGRRPDHGIRGAEGTLFDAMTNWSLASHGSNPSRQPLGSFSCTRKATPAQFVIVRCCSVDHVLPNGKRAGLRDWRQPPFRARAHQPWQLSAASNGGHLKRKIPGLTTQIGQWPPRKPILMPIW